MGLVFMAIKYVEEDEGFPITEHLYGQIYSDVPTAQSIALKSRFWQSGHIWESDSEIGGMKTNIVDSILFTIIDVNTNDYIDKPIGDATTPEQYDLTFIF